MNKKNRILILFFIFTFILVGYFSISHWMNIRNNNPKYNIQILIQTGPEKEALKSMYLAELMGLSIDEPKNIYSFDIKEAKRKLLNSPFIENANIKKYKPNAIYVDYEVRKPIAWIYDFNNVAIDRKGFFFPVNPFLIEKEMPEIYLGDKSFFDSGSFCSGPFNNNKISLALNIYSALMKIENHYFSIKRIDVSNSFLQSFGKKEIVIKLEHYFEVIQNDRKVKFIFPRTIRLCVNNYELQLSNYISLNDKMISDYRQQLKITETTPSTVKFSSKNIDMRILKLAFIDE